MKARVLRISDTRKVVSRRSRIKCAFTEKEILNPKAEFVKKCASRYIFIERVSLISFYMFNPLLLRVSFPFPDRTLICSSNQHTHAGAYRFLSSNFNGNYVDNDLNPLYLRVKDSLLVLVCSLSSCGRSWGSQLR